MAKLSSARTISATFFVTSVPVIPIPTPISADFILGEQSGDAHREVQAKIQKQVVSKIVEVIVAEPTVMDHLFEENSHYLSLKSGYISSNWYDESRDYEVDLFTDKTFEAAWDKAKQRAEAAEVKCEIVEKCIDEEEE